MTTLGGEDGNPLSSLDSTFSREEVSMDLTMCGLLVEKAEEMANLYTTHRDWTTVEDRWFEERRDGRSTRGSSRKVYRVLSSRFKTAGRSLPAIAQLPSVFEACDTRRDKAQILYFYLIEDDPLVKYVLHRYVERLQERGAKNLDFGQDEIENILHEFHYSDGEQFDYADSTTNRWGEGFRGVMREIGVIESQRSVQGESPTVGTIPLLVASGYSWETEGEQWLSSPVGWLYLFQPSAYWESLVKRVADHDSWKTSSIHGELRLEPVDEPYGWLETTEGDE